MLRLLRVLSQAMRGSTDRGLVLCIAWERLLASENVAMSRPMYPPAPASYLRSKI